MSATRDWLRDVFRAAGFRITRWRPASRFQAMDETLVLMQTRGYNPGVVIDGGANMGTWTRMVRTIYDVACLSQRPRDMRLRMGDVVFVRRDSELMADTSWE